MPFCSEITFESQGANAGYLKILNQSGDVLYNNTLIDTIVYLEFGQKATIGGVKCINLTHSNTSTDLFYVAKYPFKYSEEPELPGNPLTFPSINFGTLDAGHTFKLEKLEGGDPNPFPIPIGAGGKFAIGFGGTIGTDDMRNGKVSNTVLSLDEKKISLQITSVNGNNILELGYVQE